MEGCVYQITEGDLYGKRVLTFSFIYKTTTMNLHKENSLVEIYSGDIVEAGMIKSMLESEGIKAFLKDEIMGTLMPWWVTPGGAGSVRVIVPHDDVERSRLVVEEYEKNVKGK